KGVPVIRRRAVFSSQLMAAAFGMDGQKDAASLIIGGTNAGVIASTKVAFGASRVALAAARRRSPGAPPMTRNDGADPIASRSGKRNAPSGRRRRRLARLARASPG